MRKILKSDGTIAVDPKAIMSELEFFYSSCKEAQSEFLTLLEGAIRQPDLSQNMQRYQLAIDEAKVHLDLVIAPGAWLMPSRMVINTESTVGYNNELKQATDAMKLGVNNDVNTSTKIGLPSSDGWRGFKGQSTKQPFIKSVSQKRNSAITITVTSAIASAAAASA